MQNVILNVNTDSELKEQAENIFNELGLTMSSAINIFLNAVVKEHGLPCTVNYDEPNDETLAAMAEADRIADDPNVKAYDNIEDLKAALES